MASEFPDSAHPDKLRDFLAQQWPVDSPDRASYLTNKSWKVAIECLAPESSARDEITGGLALRIISSAMRHNGIHREFTAPERLTLLVQESLVPGTQRAFAIKCVNNAVVTDAGQMCSLAASGFASKLATSLADECSALVVRSAADSLRTLAARSAGIKADLLSDPPAVTAVLTGILADLLLRRSPPSPLGGSHRAEAAVSCLKLLFVIGPDLLSPKAKVHPVASDASSGSAGGATELTDIDRLGLVLISITTGALAMDHSEGAGIGISQPASAIPAAVTVRALAAQCLMHAPPALGSTIVACGAVRGLVDLVSSLCLAALTARSKHTGAASGTGSHGGRFGVKVLSVEDARSKKDAVDQQLWAVLLLVRHFAADCDSFCTALKGSLLPQPHDKPVNGGKLGSAYLSGNPDWLRLMKAIQLGTERVKRAGLELVLALVDGSARDLTDKVGVAMAFPVLHAKGALGKEFGV
jgi:hypothetical protein